MKSWIIALPLLFPIALPIAAAQDKEVHRRAAEIHEAALVIDTHMDTLQRVLVHGAKLGQRSSDGQADLPRFREGVSTHNFLRCGSIRCTRRRDQARNRITLFVPRAFRPPA